jgi:hypothetical protein
MLLASTNDLINPKPSARWPRRWQEHQCATYQLPHLDK